MNRHRYRWTAAALLLAAGTLPPPRPLRAQDTPFVFVPLDLNSRIARGILPYKQPFYVYGAALAGTRDVAVFYRLQPRGETAQPQCEAGKEREAGWNTPDVKPWLRRTAADTFYAALPELQPNRMYALCLQSTVQPVGEALTAFQRTAATLLDTQLREMGANLADLPNPIGPSFYRGVKLRFVRALTAQTGLNVKTDHHGGLFDTTTATLPPRHRNNLNSIIAEQTLRVSDLQAFRKAALRQPTHAGDVFGSELLARFAANAVAHDVPGLTDAEVDHAVVAALYLRDRGTTIIPEILRGETRWDPRASRTSPMPAIDEIWTEEDFAPRLANLGFSSNTARELRAAVSSVRASKALLRSIGWSAAQANTVFTGINDMVFALEQQEATLLSARTHTVNRARFITASAASASAEAHETVSLAGSSVLSFQSRAKSLVSADIGLAAVRGVGVVPYFGANFYFEPVNKAIPLSVRGSPGDRLSLTIGLTTQSVAQANDRDNLFGSFALLAGAGYRFADPLRVTVGGMVLRDVPADPLSTAQPVRVTPFLSLSLDWDVKETLGKITDKLF